MTDRNLPKWMSSNEIPALKQPQSGFHKRNVIEDDLPYLEFTGTVIYSHEKNDCSFLSQDLRAGLEPSSVIGFDIEWPPCFLKGQKKKTALVQLCTSEETCYLFHLSSMTGFPTGLKSLLEDESVMKVGVGIEGDMWKLLSDFSIKMTNFLELGDLANQKLKCVERWSLAGLVMQLFRKRLFKSNHVRCSSWDDFHLSEDQKRYAATDAYAGLIIYIKLLNWDLGPENSGSDLKDKLFQMACEIEGVAGCIHDEGYDMERASKLVEDMSANLHSLKALLKSSNTACTSPQELLPPGTKSSEVIGCSSEETSRACAQDGDDVDLNQSNFDLFEEPEEPVKNAREESDQQKEGITPHQDVSEYDVHMLEMQAEEDLEEQPTLDLKLKNTLESSSNLLDDVTSDDELELQMLQCVEEAEKKRAEEQKDPEEDSPFQDEDEDVIEEEEEEFDSSLPKPNPDHIKCLKTYFGHSCFKPVQWKVIHSVMEERRDNLVVMATGYGKSLCFQFPPVFCGGLSLVISPLIALMEDQVQQLQMSNIPACFLGSAQTNDVWLDVKRGQYKVVFITPEYCSGSLSLLEQLNTTIGITLIAVDEAHCISEWGHDFRGAYRNLGKLKTCMPSVPMIALTATASPSIRADIVKSLNLLDPLITCTSFDRPNLFLEVNRKSGNMVEDLKAFLRKKPGKEAERVSSELCKLGVTCGLYHAGLGIKQRRDSQHSFMRDDIQCIVATVAFGMGINKLDIRKVIHYGAPKDMECYYQEMGRAGRDGLPSACHILWAPGDMTVNRFLLSKGTEKFRSNKLKMMVKMERYLNSYECRRKLILSHFEDKQLRRVTSGIKGTYQCCDNCKSGCVNMDNSVCDGSIGERSRLQDFGPLVFQLLSAVAAMGERYGITTPILFLRGSNSQRVPENYRRHPLFGGGSSVPEACWKALARELLLEDLLQEYAGWNKFCTLCRITPKGKLWLNQAQDKTQRSLLLQPNRELSTWSAHRLQPSLTSTSAGRQSAPVTQNHSTLSGRIGVYERYSNSPGRAPSLMPSRPPDPVNQEELQLQEELYAKLVVERQKLASEKDIPPAILGTNKILLDIAKIRPCTVSDLKLVDGVSEAKSRMLAPFLQTIARFCEKHQLKVNCPSAVHEGEGSSHPSSLSDSVSITYRLFQEQGHTMKQVCDARSLPSAVVEAHLLQAFRAHLPLNLDRAGLTPTIRDTIIHIIQSAPINSNLNDIKAIRARIPEDISNFLLQLTVAMLQKEAVPTAPSAVPISPLQPRPAPPPQSQQVFSWLEPEMLTASRTRNVPSTSEASLPPEAALQNSTVMLESRNDISPDEDTQDICNDSSVKTFSQPSKRKLPHCIPTIPAAMNKPKKQKGLFS